ncbi:MAG: CTP-dependent riboflavin kinase [Candidatus Bathyarchaeota archaeon]|nr:CTP-dependent riboflavin kinase [Candidatus Bathyarchaeota archaeon]
MKTLCIKGMVFSGKGEGAKFIELPWVRKQITEKLGFTPHPGTLNIKLTRESLKLRTLLGKTGAIEISPAAGFHRGRCFKAYLINNLKCAVVIPETPNYPRDIIELIAPINLREKLQLRDGDYVQVKILLG